MVTEPGVAAIVVAAIERWRAERSGVLVVGVDGHGGAGKTTIAMAAARAIDAAVVHTDDFFTPASPGAPLAAYYDWRRIRAEALEPLCAGLPARFDQFDWAAGRGLDGQAGVEPADVILLEGVFAAAPQLADLVDHTILVQTPEPERLRRLHARIPADEWDEAWLAAEREYFSCVRPPSSFCLLAPGGSA